MKVKVLVFFLLFLVVGTVFAQVTISWWNVYYKYAFVAVERFRVGMEAVISFADEKGKDSSQMKSVKNEFLTAKEEFKTATDQKNQGAVETSFAKMKEIVKKFGDEAKNQFAGLERVTALAKMVQAQKENKSYFGSLLNEARNLHKERHIQVFDQGVSQGENAIQKLKDYGKDAIQTETKLNEIKNQRTGFINSIDSVISACYGIGLVNCVIAPSLEGTCGQGMQNYCGLKNEIKSDFAELANLIYKAAGLK